jgi:RNA polymerase sigma-70 factor (ECF subfamily)
VEREEEAPTIASLGRVYELRYHRFLRVAEAIVREPELARDAVQEAFARAIRSRFEYRGEGSVDAWLWRTVVNVALTARRERERAVALEPAKAAPSMNGHGGELRALIAALPERQRLVLFLRYYADLDYGRIAEVLAISPGTVGATLNHAHAAVRRLLEEVPR